MWWPPTRPTASQSVLAAAQAYVLDGKVKEVTRPVRQGLGAGESVG